MRVGEGWCLVPLPTTAALLPLWRLPATTKAPCSAIPMPLKSRGCSRPHQAWDQGVPGVPGERPSYTHDRDRVLFTLQ